MYMSSEEGVSRSCANSDTLDISLASPGSTSRPVFLKDTRSIQQSLLFVTVHPALTLNRESEDVGLT